MFCRKCGKEIPDDSVFCPKCGAELGNSELKGDSEEAAAKPSDTQHITSDPNYSDNLFVAKEKPHNKKRTTILIVAATILAALAGVFLFVILPEMHLEFSYVLSSDGENYFVTGYKGSDKNVAIPDTILWKPVTAIAANAFQGTDIENVTIGRIVEIIGVSAFQDCTKLKTVMRYKETDNKKYLGNMKVIMENAFMNCTSLAEVNLQSRSYAVQNNAFNGCVSLRSIDLSEVKEVGNYAFYNCTSLPSIDLSAVGKVGDYAFYNCDSMETVMCDYNPNYYYGIEELKKIFEKANGVDLGTGAFQGCDSLTSVSLINSHVSDYCFASCDNLEEFTGIKLSSIGQNAFEGCEKLGDVSLLGTSEENIAATAFDGCTLLKPKSQINKYGATNLIGMTESEMFDLLGYDYRTDMWAMGPPVYYYDQYGLGINYNYVISDDGYMDQSIITLYSVDVFKNGYVSSGLGSIDFVKVGMTFGEIMEYIGSQYIEFSYGSYYLGYEYAGYHFIFESYNNDSDVPDPKRLTTDRCQVYKLRQ